MDVLIVGQGIAGTCLAFELLERGKSVHIIDEGHSAAASVVGTAVINPVTGRRYAKSWNIDTLLPIALETYERIGKILGDSYLSPAEILQVLPDDRVEEIWMLRTADPEFEPYLDKEISSIEIPGMYALHVARIHQAFHLAINRMLGDSRQWFEKQQMLSTQVLEQPDLSITEESVMWQQRPFRHVVFCTGHLITGNPLFDWLEVYPMKGEYLLCEIPGLALDRHLKSKVSIFPLGNGVFWCGSTYDRYNEDPAPSDKGREYLIEHLKKLVTAPFTVQYQGAGIRATTKDRRPYLGTHPDYEAIHVLTGLGTKGASLAPYCAKLLADSMFSDIPLPGEVDILRHWSD